MSVKNKPLPAGRKAYVGIMRTLMLLCTLLTVALVLFMIGYIMYRGIPNITWKLVSTKPSALYGNIGILPDILNTLYIVAATLAVVIPLGVGAAIYLTEYAKSKRIVAAVEYAVVVGNGQHHHGADADLALIHSGLFYAAAKANDAGLGCRQNGVEVIHRENAHIGQGEGAAAAAAVVGFLHGHELVIPVHIDEILGLFADAQGFHQMAGFMVGDLGLALARALRRRDLEHVHHKGVECPWPFRPVSGRSRAGPG